MGHPYAKRRSRAQRRLRDRGADAAVAYPGPNLQYFTGFRGEPVDRFHVLLLPADGAPTLVTPEGYLTQAESNASVESFHAVPGNDPAHVAEALRELLPSNPHELLVDGDAPFALTSELSAHLAAGVVDTAEPLFRSLRRRKGPAEVAALRRSGALADRVSEAVRSLGSDAIGMTETDLAVEIRSRLHAGGATGVSFDVVVGSGPNGADPALRHGDREIREGEPVVVDFGCFLDGYASDQTRTVVFDGDPPGEFERVHEAVLDALDAGVDAVAPGRTAGDVDAAARETLADHGYADRFVHGTGHGVGLAAHEPLSISAGDRTRLEPGMVFSVEPGVYVEGEYGVRIEDLVAVTADGCERLNHSPRTWEPL